MAKCKITSENEREQSECEVSKMQSAKCEITSETSRQKIKNKFGTFKCRKMPDVHSTNNKFHCRFCCSQEARSFECL